MTYRVEFEGGALVQLNGLPSVAFDALVDRMVMLVQSHGTPIWWRPPTDRPTARPYSARATA